MKNIWGKLQIIVGIYLLVASFYIDFEGRWWFTIPLGFAIGMLLREGVDWLRGRNKYERGGGNG